MKTYLIRLKHKKQHNLKTIVINCLTFPEAAMQSYWARNRLGHDWYIEGVHEKKRKTKATEKFHARRSNKTPWRRRKDSFC